MRASPKEMVLTVENAAAAKVIGLWWLLSLIFVRALLEIPLVRLDVVRDAVPAVQKYAEASGHASATTGFYCFFVMSTPFLAVFYFRFMHLKRSMSGMVRLIMAFLIFLAAYFMTIGIDLGPRESRGFLSLFNTVLTSAWFGSSFVYLLICHVLLTAIVCIVKDSGRRFS